MESEPRQRWWQDRVTWWALAVGVYLRVLPMAAWPVIGCVRDECTYIKLSQRIIEGEGMTAAAAGWLWAPGYPYLLALHRWLTGYSATVKGTQTALFILSLPVAYMLARAVLDRRAARWLIWLLSLSPTLIFFAGSLWSECLYTAILFFALWSLNWAREGGALRATLPGVLLGICVLFRGVATYMMPIFAVGLLWGRWRAKGALQGALTLAVTAVLTVAPYSIHATERWGGTVISDRTMGQMMWLGNNEWPPMTFDWGNGSLTYEHYNHALNTGRPHCDKEEGPVAWDTCEAEGGKQWIRDNPEEFAKRIPLRLAQLMNPHSFLTRHLRWEKWEELPKWTVEPLVGLTLVWSFAAIFGGTLGFFGRARGWLMWVTGGVVLYHGAAISILAGLSRYRVPLDALWLIWTAAFLAAPRETLRGLKGWRLWGCVVAMGVLIPLTLWFLPAGFAE